MNGFAHRIAAHPVSACFALTYLLSWPLFVLVLVVFPDSAALQGVLGSVAVFAPAIASMITAGAAEPTRSRGFPLAFRIALLTTWLAAWGTLVLFASEVHHAPMGFSVIAFSGVLAWLPACIVSRAFSATKGIRRLLRSLVVPQGSLIWYAVALLVFPVIQLVGAGLTLALGIPVDRQADLHIQVAPGTAILLFLHGFFFAGGINEESGWRGFALPRLQRRYCPLAAALIVWFFWALWHLPADLASGDPASSILFNRILLNAMWSVLFLWVFNRTQGGLLAPAIIHPAMNTSGMLLPRTDAATILFGLLVLTVIAVEKMWRRLPPGHPARLEREPDAA